MDLVHLLFFALACHTTAHTFTVMNIFKPVRKWLNTKLGPFWGELFTCPYCLGHHISWVTILLFNPFEIHQNTILNFFVSWLSLTGATNFLTYLLEERIKRTKDTEIIYKHKVEIENHQLELHN